MKYASQVKVPWSTTKAGQRVVNMKKPWTKVSRLGDETGVGQIHPQRRASVDITGALEHQGIPLPRGSSICIFETRIQALASVWSDQLSRTTSLQRGKVGLGGGSELAPRPTNSTRIL
jgi:hypothetical protein